MLGLLAIGLAACGSGEALRLPPQHWGDIEIIVETRPAPIRAGMNEFLVIATERSGKPVSDMVVALRMKPGDKWRQAIQDGGSGVYRKALLVGSGRQTLYAQLRRGEAVTVLEFPLMVQ